MIIDTHAHVVPATMLEALRAERRLFPSVTLHDAMAPRLEFNAAGPGRPIQPRLHDLAELIGAELCDRGQNVERELACGRVAAEVLGR